MGGHCNEAKRAIAPYLAQATRPAEGPVDAAFITPESTEEAPYFANKLRKRLDQDATVWIIFSGKIQQLELNQQFSKVMEQSGWVEWNKISINDSFIAVGYTSSPADENEPK